MHSKLVVWLSAAVVGAGLMGAHPNAAMLQGGHGRFAESPLGKLVTGNVGRWMVLRSELNVTDEQKAKIKDAVVAHRGEIAQVAKGVWEKHMALRKAVLAASPEEQAIRTAADNLGKSIGDAAVLASKIAKDVRPALTSEQIEMLQKTMTENEGAVGRFFDRVVKTD